MDLCGRSGLLSESDSLLSESDSLLSGGGASCWNGGGAQRGYPGYRCL